MPLTPTDVANKQFRIAFRGYSLDEVDAFLDEVETELTRLLRDNAGVGDRPAAAPLAAAASTPAPVPAAAHAAPLGGMEGQEAALRTLLLAQRTADEAIAEARAEAAQIVTAAREEAETTLTSAREEAETTLTSARSEAETTLSSARSEADTTLTSARSTAESTLAASQAKAASIDQDVATRIQAATGDLDNRRRELEQRIEELRAFEREYRTRLKAYLESQLRDLDTGATPDDGGAGVPAGARSAAIAGNAGRRGPAPVAGPGGPGVVPAAAPSGAAAAPEADDEDAADGPPREADSPSSLRAVPPLAQDSAAVGPFSVVRPSDADER